jgi:subtilisin
MRISNLLNLALLIALAAPSALVAQPNQPVAGATVVRSRVAATGVVRIIARLSQDAVPPGVAMTATALARGQSNLASAARAAGVAHVEPIVGLPLVVLEVNQNQLDALMASGQIAAVQEDTIERAYLAQSVPLVHAPDAWNQGARGAGRAVAVLDTGVDRTHPFLAGRVVFEACFSSNSPAFGASTVCPNGQTDQTGGGAAAPCTVTGCDHGTHVAGIAAGRGANFSGVAPDADIIAIQVFSRFTDQPGNPNRQNCANSGLASPCALTFNSDQLRGLQEVRDIAGNFSIAAVNMSLGGGEHQIACDTDVRKGVIDQLRTAGIATVIASGNDGFTNAVGAPGCISTAVTVGATTKTDTIPNFSNSSSLVELLAPGQSINSSRPGSGFQDMSGTSMATPHVAGAFAVLRSCAPNATVNAIQNALAATGQAITDSRNNLTIPRLNVGTALPNLVPSGCAPVAVQIDWLIPVIGLILAD